MLILKITIRMTVNAIKEDSISHNRFKSGINFLKIRSEMKAITAVKKDNTTIIWLTSFWTGKGGSGLKISKTPATSPRAVMIFSGVNFKTYRL